MWLCCTFFWGWFLCPFLFYLEPPCLVMIAKEKKRMECKTDLKMMQCLLQLSSIQISNIVKKIINFVIVMKIFCTFGPQGSRSTCQHFLSSYPVVFNCTALFNRLAKWKIPTTNKRIPPFWNSFAFSQEMSQNMTQRGSKEITIDGPLRENYSLLIEKNGETNGFDWMAWRWTSS